MIDQNMKLITFTPRGSWVGRTGIVIDNDKVVDLNSGYALHLKHEGETTATAIADALMPSDMIKFLQAGRKAITRATTLLAFVRDLGKTAVGATDPSGRRIVYDMKEVKLNAPLPRPSGIGIGFFNDKGIIEEAARVRERELNKNEQGLKTEIIYPKKAAIVWGQPGCVIGPEDAIIYPKVCAERAPRVFNGIELGLVVGKRAYRVPKEEVKEYIAGYTVTSDITAYDLVGEEIALYSLVRAKDMPTFWPMGPWISTKDEIDPTNLELKVRINGKLAMSANTKNYIFDPYDYIHDVSEYMLLEPGTVIAMGSFVGTTYNFIKPGDVVENEIEGIGVLRNHVVAEDESLLNDLRGREQ